MRLDARTFWLIVTNIVLGAAVLLVTIGVATEVLCEWVGRLRKKHSVEHEIERDMHSFFGKR
ncbi:MAG TPA: hypothetical protein VMH28_01340 [Candidatus Acidoferrales bacterium]|nr:hypothetical protein [Candidatus Acidoferrales bacterium]